MFRMHLTRDDVPRSISPERAGGYPGDTMNDKWF